MEVILRCVQAREKHQLKAEVLFTLSQIKAENAKVLDEVEFKGPPKTVQKLWPRHCVRNTWGSELHSDLKVSLGSK